MSNDVPVLEATNLKKYFDQSTSIVDSLFRRGRSEIRAVDDVSLSLERDEAQGVIGESGCGKTTLLMTLMGLYEPTGGELFFKGRDVSEFDKADWKEFRREVQIVFQDPFNSLDPKMTIEESLLEPMKIHGLDDRDERIRTALRQAELSPPEQYLPQLPRQLSGGEKQRVSIARALALEPEVILADEPVSMLDVSTQAAVLELLSDLREEMGLSLLYISHDLSTVAYVCDTIHVMYLGRIVESAPTLRVIQDPKHPYSQALIDAIPIPDPHHKRDRVRIEGAAMEAAGENIGEGCRFRGRCPERMDVCENTPAFVQAGEGQFAACHLYYDHEEHVQREQEDRYSGEISAND